MGLIYSLYSYITGRNDDQTDPVEDPAINSIHEICEADLPNRNSIISETLNTNSNTYCHTDDVDKINLIVTCTGKSVEILIFPAEKISILLQEACELLWKKPEKMSLVFQGELLNVQKRVNQYPRLRGGSKVNLIHAC